MLTTIQKISLLRRAIYAPDFASSNQQHKWYATVKANQNSILLKYGNEELFIEAATLWLAADNLKFAAIDDVKLMKIQIFKMTLSN